MLRMRKILSDDSKRKTGHEKLQWICSREVSVGPVLMQVPSFKRPTFLTSPGPRPINTANAQSNTRLAYAPSLHLPKAPLKVAGPCTYAMASFVTCGAFCASSTANAPPFTITVTFHSTTSKTTLSPPYASCRPCERGAYLYTP
jgi:hypothetical protein